MAFISAGIYISLVPVDRDESVYILELFAAFAAGLLWPWTLTAIVLVGFVWVFYKTFTFLLRVISHKIHGE